MRENLLSVVKNFAKNPLVRSSVFISAVNFAGGLVNFAFQIIMGRIMDPKDYGIFIPLISLTMVVGLPAVAIQTVMVKDMADLVHTGDLGTLRAYFKRVLKIVLAAGAVITLGCFAATPLFMDNLHVTYAPAFFLVFIKVFVDIAIAPLNGLLQARERFHVMALNIGGGALVKLVAGVGLVLLMKHYVGGLAGIFIATVAVLAVAAFDALRFREAWKAAATASDPSRLKLDRLVKTFLQVIVTIGAYQLLTQLDTLLVRKYLPGQSEIYSPVSIIGKASFFIATALSVVLLPAMAKDKGNYHRSNRNALLVLLLVLAAYAGALAIGTPLVSNILFAGRYPGMEAILPLYGFMFLPYAAITFLVSYYVVSEKIFYSVVLLIGAAAMAVLVRFFHSSLIEVTLIVGAVGYAVLALLALDSIVLHKEKGELPKHKTFA